MKIGGMVSICVPTYNRPHLISQLLDSIFAQSYKNFEIIITDNSDNSETKELLLSQYKSQKIIYIKNEKNLGMDGNTLRALSYASGEFFTFTPDDDVWIDSDKLAKQIKLLYEFPEIPICFSNVIHINHNGSIHKQQFKLKPIISNPCEIIDSTSLLLTNKDRYFINILTAVMRVEILDLFRESWSFGSEEYFMWYVGGTGQEIGFCYDATVAHRDGDHNWGIADGRGNLVNYRNNVAIRAKQVVNIYSALRNKYNKKLKFFSIETEKVIFDILINLIGKNAFQYKSKLPLISMTYCCLQYTFSLAIHGLKSCRRIASSNIKKYLK
jgi:glycosyltransferase involved in cell wall biosynthesis